mgnify:CR=1 FL=1
MQIQCRYSPSLCSRCSPVEPKLGTKRMNRQSCRHCRWACTSMEHQYTTTTPLSLANSHPSHQTNWRILIVWTWPVFTCLHNFPTNTLHPFSLHINASTQSRHHRFSSIHLETKSQRVELILKIFEIFVQNRIIRLKYLTKTFTFSLYFR